MYFHYTDKSNQDIVVIQFIIFWWRLTAYIRTQNVTVHTEYGYEFIHHLHRMYKSAKIIIADLQ